MILIITRKGDIHGQYVADALKTMGEEVEIVDYSTYPLDLQIISSYIDNINPLLIKLPNRTLIDGSTVKSVLNRRPGTPRPPKGIRSKRIRDYMIAEAQAVIDSMPQLLECFWINNPDTIRRAGRKLYQLGIAQRVGFHVPRTLISNSPDELRKFVSEGDSDYVLKPVFSSGVNVVEDGQEKRVSFYTKKYSRDDVLALADMAANNPSICQEYVAKVYELRVTVVGREIFACRIDSQSSEIANEDWRRYDVDNTPHSVATLPDGVRSMIYALMDKLDLVFGCIDLIVTPVGEYVFLEINPNGQWLWIEELTQLPITESLTQMLRSPPSGE